MDRIADAVVDRRGFLALAGAGLAAGAAAAPPRAKAVIQVCLVGGPSQLETWDPKPDAPATVRGPMAAIATRVPGVRISEGFPRLATLADRFALVRTVHHQDAPIHETGLQWLNTGANGDARHLGARSGGWIGLPGPVGDTGVRLSKGQHGADWQAPAPAEGAAEPASVRARYGDHPLGRLLAAARRRVERGARLVTVNMFRTVFGGVSWDAHAAGGRLPATLGDYRALCPTLDQALAGLLADLADRGLLDSTLVVASGEFGRTPRLNPRGGRDHWPSCWTALVAGGGVRGGTVVGRSDALAAEPADRPVHVAELHATMAACLGLPASAPPLRELFA